MTNPRDRQTRLTRYPEFCAKADTISDPLKRAFLEALFWSARRVSEVLLLEQHDLTLAEGILFANIWHLKKHKYKKGKFAGKSKNYKRVQEIPMTRYLYPLLDRPGKVFPFSRQTGWRIVKDAFPQLYPHYFRLNMRTIIGIEVGEAEGRALLDIDPASDAHYTGIVSLKRVGQSMQTMANKR